MKAIYMCASFLVRSTSAFVDMNPDDVGPPPFEHRKLLTAGEAQSKFEQQANAANKIQEVVKVATQSGVNGVAFSINYVLLQEGLQQMTVGISVSGVEKEQQLLIDTGTTQCTGTGDPVSFTNATCITNNSAPSGIDGNVCSGSEVSWVGSVYQGDVTAYDTYSDQEVAVMENVFYGIIDSFSFYACDGPLDGIIGIAFTELNEAYQLSRDGTTTTSDLLDVLCTPTSQDKVAVCDTDNLTLTHLHSPIEQALMQDVEEGIDIAEGFGLYVDYKATRGADANKVIPGLGIYFGGDVAFNNSIYNGGTPKIAGSPATPNLNMDGGAAWYSLILQSIRIPGANLSYTYPEEFCTGRNRDNCITDTGSSRLNLPLPQEHCDQFTSLPANERNDMLFIHLEDNNGGTISLNFPLAFLLDEAALGWISCTGLDGRFVLGMPVFQFYYLVYDMGNATVTFVDLPQEDALTAPTVGSSNSSAHLLQEDTLTDDTGGSSTTSFRVFPAILFSVATSFFAMLQGNV